MSRGPKVKTARNSRVAVIRHETLEPPSTLTKPARAEFDRLVGVLRCKGTLERVDLGILAEAGRVKALLDQMHRNVEKDPNDWRSANRIGTLTTQRRALFRELGLTLLPSRSMIKTNPVGSDRDEEPGPWASKLKVS
jgi:phage terminase small subunit